MRKTNTRVLRCSSCFAFFCPRGSMASSSSPRFFSLTEEEKGNLLDKATPTSTKTNSRYWMDVFEDFCKENGRVCVLKTVTEEDIASILEDFYVGVRRQDKSEYKRASLINARGAIQRQLNVLDRGMDIKRGKFARADKMLDAVLVDKKTMWTRRSGGPQEQHLG